MSRFKQVYSLVIGLGDHLGKLITVLTLPAAIIGSATYWDEISDSFSQSNLVGEIKRGTLRCNYVWSMEDYKRYQKESDVLNEVCNKADLSASFEVLIKNNDSIKRDIQSLSVKVDIPVVGEFTWDEILEVEHVLNNGFESNVRKNWRTLSVPPNGSVIVEILAIPSNEENRRPFLELFNLLTEKTQILNKTATIQLYAKTNDKVSELLHISSCNMLFDEEEMRQWETNKNKIQITDQCK